MRQRLKGSGNGARWLGVPTISLLVGSALVGLFVPNPSYVQTGGDRVMLPFVIAGTAIGLFLLLRLPLIGVWFGPNDMRVRSWFTTKTVLVDGDIRCTPQTWSSWINDWNADRSGNLLNVLALTWTDAAGRRRAAVYYGTLAHWRTTRAQAAIIEEFAAAARANPSWSVARAFARGPEREATIERVRVLPRRVVDGF
ncbi:hypothetical protein ACFCVO_08815 [Agromyces sp. NPDC056379]|uniref:hypothetical protein n=1 Tax=unclassified Agromyces TaxID=2639701 RepID=UPI0035DD7B31